MTYVLISHYECVGAGEIIGGPDVEVYETKKIALREFKKTIEGLRALVKIEIETIESSPNLIFDSPYIIWAAIFHLPFRNTTEAAAISYLSSMADRISSDDDCSVEDLTNLVANYAGWIYGPYEEVYSLDDAIDGVVQKFVTD